MATLRTVACVALLAAASTAFGTTIFTNEAEFLGVIQPGYYVEDFTGWTYGDPYGSIIQTPELDFGPVNGWEWHVETDPGTSGLWSNDSALSTASAVDDLLITFPSGPPVTAVAGIFASTDYGGGVIPYDVTVTLGDGTSHTMIGQDFVGFTSPGAPIASVRVAAPDDQATAWPEVDHFYVGSSVIPEPATLSLLGLGLLAVARRRRRR
jgi:hypothetical protein